MGRITVSDPDNDLQPVDVRRLWDIFAQAEDLPTLPEVSVRLMDMIDDPESSARDVAAIIEEDPAIAAKVLKMCNSALYSPINSREVNSVRLAVSRMGFVAVANIAISASVFEAFNPSRKPAFNRYEFWRHSVSVGVIAALLHDRVPQANESPCPRETVHLAGIVHDMGKILFERYANNPFHTAILKARHRQISLATAEKDVLGVAHDQAGAWLAERWHLSRDVVDVIRHHHTPSANAQSENNLLVKLIHVADYIAHKLSLGDSGNPAPECDKQVLQELGVDGEMIQHLGEPIKEQIRNSQILLAIAM